MATGGRVQVDAGHVIQDTLDELVFLALIFLTAGVIFLVGAKRPTEHSLIHPLFKKVGYFTPAPPRPDKYCQRR